MLPEPLRRYARVAAPVYYRWLITPLVGKQRQRWAEARPGGIRLSDNLGFASSAWMARRFVASTFSHRVALLIAGFLQHVTPIKMFSGVPVVRSSSVTAVPVRGNL